MLTPVRRGAANLDKPTEQVRGAASRLPWAWAGLCFGAAMHDANPDGFRDIVNGLAPSAIGQIAWTRDDRGNPAATFINNSYCDYGDQPIHERPTTAVTAYVRLKPNVASATDGAAFYMPYEDAAPWSSWGIQAGNTDPASLYGSISLGTTTEYITPETGAISPTSWQSLFLRWQSGSALMLDVLGERGNRITSVTTGTPLTGSIGYNPGWGLRINAAASPFTRYEGTYSQAMLWNRRLTDTELSALVADPYGWYSPSPQSLGISSPYPLVFGGGEMRGGTAIGGLR